ncbi:D-alanyl-D-alanine carboxypeptidase [hydrothermal vent metagenome]|uniref:serine-type D-Ala-D-Ala carboxypeptidase n=1 Tax=hydrothermal vent metagenome TaxID=652676 RepID=A0A3B0R8S5_9ZZZZ
MRYSFRQFLWAAFGAGIMLVTATSSGFALSDTYETTAKQAILIDSRSGTVYFNKDADELMAPASMSKIMTMLLVFEGLKDGSLRLDDEFTVSTDAWRRGGAPSGGSTMYAKLNSRIKLRDLIRGVIIQSGNDAAIVIAEGIAGSEEAYARRMTKRARELGLTKSTFKNATGLPDPEHKVTARELSQLTRYLIEVFPEFYKIYSEQSFTWNKIKQGNRNPLLGKYPGADGVKTGHTNEAGFGLVGSAVRDGRRLIVVLNGMKSKAERSRESIKMLDWGFRRFQRVALFRQGDNVAKARVWGGIKSFVPLVAKEDISIRLSDKERKEAEMIVRFKGPIKAPVRAGQELGSVVIMLDGKTITSAPLVAAEKVIAEESMWNNAIDTLMFKAFGG